MFAAGARHEVSKRRKNLSFDMHEFILTEGEGLENVNQIRQSR